MSSRASLSPRSVFVTVNSKIGFGLALTACLLGLWQIERSLTSSAREECLDWGLDPETAEVRLMDGLQQVILSHCARQPDFVTGQTQLVEGVFRIFLSNGNTPLSPLELSERLGRPANTILITLSGPRVYKGIRPILAR